MEMILAYSGNKDGLMDYLDGVIVCERCGSFDGGTYSTIDPETDKTYYWSMCDICQDDMS